MCSCVLSLAVQRFCRARRAFPTVTSFLGGSPSSGTGRVPRLHRAGACPGHHEPISAASPARLPCTRARSISKRSIRCGRRRAQAAASLRSARAPGLPSLWGVGTRLSARVHATKHPASCRIRQGLARPMLLELVVHRHRDEIQHGLLSSTDAGSGNSDGSVSGNSGGSPRALSPRSSPGRRLRRAAPGRERSDRRHDPA
jgi:hypothetical protein